jgi:hypothetical protein
MEQKVKVHAVTKKVKVHVVAEYKVKVHVVFYCTYTYLEALKIFDSTLSAQ